MKKSYKNRVNVFRVFTVFILILDYISVYIWPVGITWFDTGPLLTVNWISYWVIPIELKKIYSKSSSKYEKLNRKMSQ